MLVTDDMTIVFGTESGSVYEIDKGWFRKVNADESKGEDGGWHRLIVIPGVWFGDPVSFIYESPEGLDTIRVTTPVQGITVREAENAYDSF